jgi:hypothetical protein
MEAKHVCSASPFMKTIYILRDNGCRRIGMAPPGKNAMGVVRLAFGNKLTSPVVPFPHHFGIGREGFRRRQLLWSMIFP